MSQVYVALSLALPTAKRESLLVSKERDKQQAEDAGIHGFDFLLKESYHTSIFVSRLTGRPAGPPDSLRFARLREPWYHPGVNNALNVWLLNPYAAGSHKAWADGFAAHSRHEVEVLEMQGHFWKWRMHGGALELAEQARRLLARGTRPDVLIATSMTNVPAFLALMRRELSTIPLLLYMHENQLTYPPPPGTKRDLTYGMIQHLSMTVTDEVRFNSAYHMNAWFAELPRLLKHFPDYTHLQSIDAARAKAAVLPVGCHLHRLDRYRAAANHEAPPLVLWSQRWEYDKDPQTMLAALYALADEGIPFRVALAGESFRVQPTEFAAASKQLGPRLVHYGYAESEAEYACLLWSADIVLSTAIHEFFGVGVTEAIYCGATPVLPRRLSYPELLPVAAHEHCLYDDFNGLTSKLPRRAGPAGCAPGSGRARGRVRLVGAGARV